MTKDKLLKSERIRLKNDKLRAKGKDPLKGWGKMINTGLGGINKAQAGIGPNYDSKVFIAEQQKEISRDIERRKK